MGTARVARGVTGMDYGLAGRVALVNAASRGLGRAIAEALAAEGTRLVISARDKATIGRAADEIAAAHRAEVIPVAADVAVAGTAERLVATAVERFGALDILVNNSGGPPHGTFADFDDAAWQHAFDLLLLNVVRMVRAARPHLRASGRGRIINVASVAAREPIGGLVLSNSLRAAVAGLAKTLADELARDQITVNTVLPGRILTDRLRETFTGAARAAGADLDEFARAEVAKHVPLGRVGEPADLGNLVAFLCSRAASYLTGLAVAVDGGWMRAIL
jgi:3-oxoacyl-[acyl-carrier protein] reductase